MHKAFRSLTTSKPNYYRVVTPLAFIIAVSGLAGCGSDSNTHTARHRSSQRLRIRRPILNPVSIVLGVRDHWRRPAPAGDSAAVKVTFGKHVTSGELGSASVALTVTNRSSQRSDYAITVALVSGNGKQLATKTAFVNNLGPGQSTTRPVISESYNTVPAGTRVTLLTTQRYPS